MIELRNLHHPPRLVEQYIFVAHIRVPYATSAPAAGKQQDSKLLFYFCDRVTSMQCNF